MKDFRIVIPTHNRVNKQTTLGTIPPAIRDDVLLVSSLAAEAKQLKQLYPNNEVVVAKGAKGIASKRQWIMKNIDEEKVLMLDDDMHIFGRCPKKLRVYEGRWKRHPDAPEDSNLLAVRFASPAKQVKMYTAISKKLDTLAHAGISSRMGNDCEGNSWAINGRMMHAIGYNRKVFLQEKLNFGEVKFREDFNITLHLLRRGFSNTIYYDYCYGPGNYGAPGGASAERTVEASNKEAEKLARIHNGFVRVVDKEYNNVPRKEVNIQWKKAYASFTG